MINSDVNLKTQIHDSILTDIINGEYNSSSIIHEKDLMEKYEVSRAPIREALIQLCSEGNLQNLPKRGYIVPDISLEEMKSISYFRLVLECTFLKQNYYMITKEALEELENFTLQMETSHSSPAAALTLWKDNVDFHLLLFSNYNNPFAYDNLKKAMLRQIRFYSQTRFSRWHSPVFSDPSNLHTAIVDYIKQGNINMATNILKADIENISSL